MSELWLKLAVNFPRHPKVIAAGADAAWLAVCAMLYAREHSTDGLIRATVVPMLTTVKRPMVVAARLVEVGLWETISGDFIIHDFLEWNPSREVLSSKREKWKDTKRTQRSVQDGHSVGQIEDTHETPRVRADAPARSAHSASVSLSAGLELEGGVGETDRQERQRYGPPIIGSPREHRSHGWCNDRGLCLPAFLYAELLCRIGQHRQDELRAWMGSVIDGLGETVPGEPAIQFWRSRFEVWQGSTVPSKAQHRPAAQPDYNGDWREECKHLHGSACGSQFKHGLKMANEIAGFIGEKKPAAAS